MIALFALVACTHEQPVFDELGPEVSILTPVDGDQFDAGATVTFIVEFEENLGLHGYFIWLISEDGTDAFLVHKEHVHTTSYRVEVDYVMPDTPGQQYELLVEANDHDNNVSHTSVFIDIN